MKVYGVEITAEQIAAADAVIFNGSGVRCEEVAIALHGAGVKAWGPAYRAADRILQKHRKSGRIYYSKELKCWLESE